MKKILSLSLAFVLGMSLLSGCGGSTSEEPAASDSPPAASSEAAAPADDSAPAADASAEEITLTMGSWRADDVDQMNSLLKTYKETVAPNVTITFQPTNPQDYNATLRMQLDSGTGPDLMYARSYETGQELFESGHFADLSDLAGKANFSDANLEPWTTTDGKLFAVPFAAVSHGVYYNKTIFDANGLTVPETWADFIKVCQTLKDAGITPLANGVADEWDILETFFLGMLTNYTGGPEGRIQYENGSKALNDATMVAAYTDFAQIQPFLESGFEAITYNDSQALFNTESAAMFADGSWTIGVYEDAGFEWGIFALPAPTKDKTAITFHPDMAITMNPATSYPEEAKQFLEWIASVEGATTASALLPVGFFPMIDATIQLDHPQANEFLALNEGRATDARFVWPKLMGLYTPMNQAVIKILKGEFTPQQAADSVQAEFEAL